MSESCDFHLISGCVADVINSASPKHLCQPIWVQSGNRQPTYVSLGWLEHARQRWSQDHVERTYMHLIAAFFNKNLRFTKHHQVRTSSQMINFVSAPTRVQRRISHSIYHLTIDRLTVVRFALCIGSRPIRFFWSCGVRTSRTPLHDDQGTAGPPMQPRNTAPKGVSPPTVPVGCVAG